MADTPRRELSSVFDDMLAHNRKRFDDLYRGGRSKAGGSTATVGSSAGLRASASATPSIVLDPTSSPAIRRLNERFGNDWRYEIFDRQRDGDEAIVLCRLTFGKEGAVRSQFGRAKLPSGPAGGTSGGMHFTLSMGDVAKDEGDAFRRATEAALMNCLDLS
jgi:hypothetical protein